MFVSWDYGHFGLMQVLTFIDFTDLIPSPYIDNFSNVGEI